MSRRKLVIGLAAAGLLSAGLGSSIGSAPALDTSAVPNVAPLPQVTCPGGLPAIGGVCQPPAPPPEPPPSAPPPHVTHHQSSGSGSTSSGGSKSKGGGRTESESKPTSKGGGKTTSGGTKSKSNGGAPSRGKNGETRSSSGAPTVDNPTFSFAQAGVSPLGVPNFFIEKFRIPPFLLPIYQAAGTEYGIPWQVLAAINEIETDYGRNLNVSSAGALGWMQFIPSSWQTYGVDANGDNIKDPYNPVDAIFAAARYLKAADGDKNLNKAIFAYNHADWYVQSVLLRAKLIGGMPAALIGSLTGLTEGHFPVAANATYADDLNERKATRRVKSGNAAVPVESDPSRRAVNIYSRVGAPVIAVNDGLVKRLGTSKDLGRYVVLQDGYGNEYTYAHLGEVAPSYPAAKPVPVTAQTLKSEPEQPRDKAPNGPASAGGQARGAPRPGPQLAATLAVDRTGATKQRLFAHPARPASYRAGGDSQVLATSTTPLAGYSNFDSYVQRVLGLKRSDTVIKPLKPGAQVIAGTVLGRIDKTDSQLAPHVTFSIKPAGRGAPQIDPKPILDGWKLLEATAIYRAAGKNPFWGPNARNPTIGQILLMSKPQLEMRVLNDPRIQIYDCGRQDIQAHLIDRRVLAMLEFLSGSGLKPYVSTLKCGHSYYVAGGGMVSEHSYGDAADIAEINGIPILGHQGKGSITDITIRRLLTLQATMQPNQIISLMDYPGVPYAWSQGDHANHIHVGFPPLFGDSAKLAQQYNTLLKPNQWVKLIDRLNSIDNPVVPTKPSKYATPSGKAG
jgi:hypothetical protein